MADLLDFIGFKTFSTREKNSRSFYLLPFYLFTICLLTGTGVNAQTSGADEQAEMVPANLAPPAVKVISKEEKTALAGADDVKDRTKLALDLMEARLKRAELLNTESAFGALLVELGSFHALMDDTIRFLNRSDNGSGKIMNNFKRFEMALRAFMPRIELIRRDLPDRYEYHVRKLLITVRDTRSKAVEPFFSTTILPAGN
jgi:hypothetical protein